MKKVFLILITIILVCSGCAKDQAAEAVRHYLDKFNNHDTEVLIELDELVKEEQLTDHQSELYKEIMKKQYTDLRYVIVDEKYNGDEATVITKVSVYDLFGVQKDANDYLQTHQQEFLNENKEYDENLFLNYKLEQMKNVKQKVDYTIEFNVTKENGKWVLNNPNKEALEKIHGIYDYTND